MLVLLVFWVTAVSGEYMFTLPQTMEAGSITKFCLILDDLEYGGFDPDQGYLVTVDLLYAMDQDGIVSQEYNNVRLGIRSPDGDFQACQEVSTPQNPGTYMTSVNVSITYTPEGQTEELSDRIISASKEVHVSKPGLITLVQTDRPLYKPGHTVKFRVMTMDYKLVPRTDGYQEITIETPAGLRVMQWKDVPAPTGLVSLEMPLSQDPVLGTWNIKAVYGSETTTQPFKVEEYVLPKFEVKITPPKYLLPTTRTISGTVCAKYTYGKPVKGQLKMEVCYKPSYYYYYRNRYERPCALIIAAIDGCYEFFINAEDIKLGHRNYSSWGQLTINATVTEAETGVELGGTSRGPSMSFNPLNLRIEDDSSGYYKPGFPFKGRVIVTNPDASPAPGEVIKVEADSYDLDHIWTKTFTSNEDGVVAFTITGLDYNTSYLNIRADAVVYETDWRYTEDELYFRTYTPQAYSQLTKWYSPSNSYIYIPDIDGEVECGSILMLDVYYNAEKDEKYKFISVVRAGDTVVRTDQHTLDTDSATFDLDILSVDENQRLIKEPKPTVPTLPPLPSPPTPGPVFAGEFVMTDTQDEDTGADTTTEEPETVEEEIIVPQVARTLGRENPRKKRETNLIGHFKLAVPVTEEMGPSAKVLVFYVRDDKEVVASSLEFNIKGCFRNKVSMSFEETTVHPGDDATLNLAASPESTCFIGMVDKSVHLLGGNNMLTPELVFIRVKQAGRPYHYISYWEEDRDYCMGGKGQKDDDYYYFQSSAEGVDALWAFRDTQMWVETDFTLESRPCKEYSPPVFYATSEVESAPRGGQIPPSPIERQAAEPERIRSYFPETWLWDIVTVGDGGTLSFTTAIPDTITEWVGNAVCTHGTDGVGVSNMTGVTGFQPFFISLTLPYSAVRGETLPVLVTVFNYLQDCVTMELRMKDSEGFQFAVGSDTFRQFCLCGGESESTKFYIIPTVIGHIDLEVTAVSIEESGLCDNVVSQEWLGVSDGVQRQLLIEAEGVQQDLTTGSYICVKAGASAMETFQLMLPEDLVPDSERATMSVVGDIMGPTMSNLKNLLRMPYGCGEQNMASWSPNIYVLQYLSGTNQLTEELEQEAEGYMRVGYQRQLNYRHNDNSYSAWGENEYGNATGSLWLTAFVVKSMAQSSKYINIDEEDIKKSAKWLMDKQEETGCFPQVGKVFSSYLKGGFDGENPAGLTAFTLIALMEANLGTQDSLQKGFNGCLDSFSVQELDTYTLSVMLYAYTLFNMDAQRRIEVLQEVEKRKIQEDSLVHWKREDQEPPADYFWYRAPSAEVEMTAYVLMSRLAEGRGAISFSQPIVQWLTKQRNPYGGFSSTQDTVVALQALAKYGSMTYSQILSLTIEAKNTRLNHVFTINADNSLVYQSADVNPNDGSVEVTVSGTGCALVQMNLKYNIYQEEEAGPAFGVNVKIYRSRTQSSDCHMRTLEICSRYLKQSGLSNMAITEVKMPTGWAPETSTLKQLVNSERIQKFEVDKNYVQIYFDELTRKTLCIDFDVVQQIEMTTKPALVTVYDYYETSYSVTAEYEIKTTCGTKEEIPLDNAGLDCDEMQCRVDGPEAPVKCPACIDTIDETELETLTCNSHAVYKAIVGRSGDYPVKVKANLREKEKVVLDEFVTYRMDTSCKCPIITSGRETRALIFMDGMALNLRTSELMLQQGMTVLKYSTRYEKLVRQLATRSKLCSKLARLRRSSSKRSATRLAKDYVGNLALRRHLE